MVIPFDMQLQAWHTEASLCMKLPPGSTARPNWQKGCSVPSDVLLSDKSWGEREGRGDICGCGICIPIPEPPPGMLRLSFPGGGWTPACQWEAVNQFLFLLCLGTQLWLSILKCHYLHLQVSSPSLNLFCILWERVLSWVQAWLFVGISRESKALGTISWTGHPSVSRLPSLEHSRLKIVWCMVGFLLFILIEPQLD